MSYFKSLAIITDSVHSYDSDGSVKTENHIFLKQMEAMAGLFKRTVICCPFEKYSPERITSAYRNPSIDFITLPKVGGNSLKQKIKLLFTIPSWIKAFKKVYKDADIIYQRFPNNLNIPGFFYFYFKKAKVFGTYTGTWKNYPGEPLTYRLQKWLLKNFFRGPVGLYITEPAKQKKFFKSISPSYTYEEWEDESDHIEKKINRLQKQKIHCPVFISVGALDANKNQQFILNAFRILNDEGYNFKLYIVGDGPLKKDYKLFINNQSLQEKIFCIGKKSHSELKNLYRNADFIVQATKAEGYGKVPVEGFFYGLIPFISNTAFAIEMTGNGERGFVYDAADILNLVSHIKYALKIQAIFPELIKKGREYAKSHTLETWIDCYKKHLDEFFTLS